MKKKLNIVLITGHQYPIGTALTNRIRSYLEKLASIGHKVDVFIYRPSEEKHNIQNAKKGILNGVEYRSTALSIIKSRNPYIARVTWIYGYINCLNELHGEHKKNGIDIIIQASSKSSIIPLVYLFCKVNHIKFVFENSEYPWFIIKKNKKSNFFYRFLYLKIYYKMFDGVIAMTNALVEYHTRYSKKDVKIIHLPMTVDMSRFDMDIPRENLITYVGNVSYYKDGVGYLLDAFMKIASEIPDWKLMLVGDTSRDRYIQEKAKEAGIDHRIVMTGMVHRDKVPELVCKSKILVLARPDSVQSEGGFPTKLGEYLASGNLVIVTKVGEIPDYLEDNISALLVSPGNVVELSERLLKAVINYENLSIIRKKGKQICREVFNADIQGERLSSFFIELVKSV